MSSQARWIKSKAEGSLNPVQVETALSEITSGWDGSLPDFLREFPSRRRGAHSSSGGFADLRGTIAARSGAASLAGAPRNFNV